MITHDPKRVRLLQRKVEDNRRIRRCFKLGYFGIFLAYAGAILSCVLVADPNSPLIIVSVLFLVFGTIGLILVGVWLFGELAMTPFRDVRDAERALEDYYDEVGYSL